MKHIVFLVRQSEFQRKATTGLESLAKGLAGHGFKVSVISGGHEPSEIKSDIDYYFCGQKEKLYQGYKPILKEIIRKKNIDVLIGRYTSLVEVNSLIDKRILCIASQGSIERTFLKRFSKNKRSSSIIGAINFEKELKKTRNIVDGIVGISEKVLESSLSTFQLPTSIGSVIHRGVNHHFFTPNAIKENLRSFRVLFVGNVIPSKGVEELIIALKNTKCNFPIDLHLIGPISEEYKAKLLSLAHSPKTNIVLAIPGPFKMDQLLKEYQQANLFVFPSHSEGLGKAMLEAMSCGLPVIASNLAPIREVITHEKNGLLFETRNIKDLTQKLNSAINSGGLRKRISKEARLTVSTNFSIYKEIDNWIQYIHGFH